MSYLAELDATRGVKDIPVVIPAASEAYFAEHRDELQMYAAAMFDFRVFLNYWYFIDQESGGAPKILGHILWPAQEQFITASRLHDWIFYLKARKLGESTIECAYDAWVLLSRAANTRVHIFSKREKDAQGLLGQVIYGLRRLPEPWRFPMSDGNLSELKINVSEDDSRIAVAYPSDKETAVQETCLHGHVDEWARMGNPAKVWQAIEPTMAGTCHFVTTGLGPTNFTSAYWRLCLAGDAKSRRGDAVHPCFIGALNRPGRTVEWLAEKRVSLGDDAAAMQEYPLRWEDALSGGGEFVFSAKECDAAAVDARPLGAAEEGHKYVKAVDTGRIKDAAVILVLDVTGDVHDVVEYRRLRETPYPTLQQQIEDVHVAYPGITWIEENAAGLAVKENLKIPEHELEGFKTTESSKARIVQQVKIKLQLQQMKWDAELLPQLDAEMRGYQIPDKDVVQDSVIALCIAEEGAAKAYSSVGRLRGVIAV